jgi:hypothetical protein
MPSETDGLTASVNKWERPRNKLRDGKWGATTTTTTKRVRKFAKYLCDLGTRLLLVSSQLKKAYLTLLKKEKDHDKIKSLAHASGGDRYFYGAMTRM